MDRNTKERVDITVPELKELLSEIYDICERNINSVEFYDTLLDKLKDKIWSPQLVQQFGIQVREIVSAIRDYNKGRFRNADVNDIAFATSLLLYYTEPTGILPKAKQALNPETEVWVTQILVSQSSNLLKNYQKHVIETNGLIRDVLGSNLNRLEQDNKSKHNGLWNIDLGYDEDTPTDIPTNTPEEVIKEDSVDRHVNRNMYSSRDEDSNMNRNIEGDRYSGEGRDRHRRADRNINSKDDVDRSMYNGNWDRDDDVEHMGEVVTAIGKPVRRRTTMNDTPEEEYTREEHTPGDNLTYE